jgi:hypothetical protein
MGSVIARSAAVERIFEAARKALTASRARGAEILALAQTRIEPIITVLGDNEQQLKQARAEDDAKWAALLARDEESDREIGSVCDEIWNAMGRPSQSIDYNLVVNGGKKVWTEGDPTKQPALMAVLAKNIRNSDHPKLAARKEEWAKRIEAKATAQAEAARPTEGSYAQVTTLTMQRRTLADALQVGLVRFKRDLKNLGMTEAQVHEIIPDMPSHGRGSDTPPAPNPAPLPS